MKGELQYSVPLLDVTTLFSIDNFENNIIVYQFIGKQLRKKQRFILTKQLNV